MAASVEIRFIKIKLSFRNRVKKLFHGFKLVIKGIIFRNHDLFVLGKVFIEVALDGYIYKFDVKGADLTNTTTFAGEDP